MNGDTIGVPEMVLHIRPPYLFLLTVRESYYDGYSGLGQGKGNLEKYDRCCFGSSGAATYHGPLGRM